MAIGGGPGECDMASGDGAPVEADGLLELVRMLAGRFERGEGRWVRVRREIWPPWMEEFVSNGRLAAEGGRGRSGPSGGGEM